MQKRVDYIVRLSNTERYRHFHIRVRGKIVFFRVQLEISWKDQWQPVVRYDTAHGLAHRDLMNRKGEVTKTPLFNQDFNDAPTFAENDLKTNWRYYKRYFQGDR